MPKTTAPIQYTLDKPDEERFRLLGGPTINNQPATKSSTQSTFGDQTIVYPKIYAGMTINNQPATQSPSDSTRINPPATSGDTKEKFFADISKSLQTGGAVLKESGLGLAKKRGAELGLSESDVTSAIETAKTQAQSQFDTDLQKASESSFNTLKGTGKMTSILSPQGQERAIARGMAAGLTGEQVLERLGAAQKPAFDYNAMPEIDKRLSKLSPESQAKIKAEDERLGKMVEDAKKLRVLAPAYQEALDARKEIVKTREEAEKASAEKAKQQQFFKEFEESPTGPVGMERERQRLAAQAKDEERAMRNANIDALLAEASEITSRAGPPPSPTTAEKIGEASRKFFGDLTKKVKETGASALGNSPLGNRLSGKSPSVFEGSPLGNRLSGKSPSIFEGSPVGDYLSGKSPNIFGNSPLGKFLESRSKRR